MSRLVYFNYFWVAKFTTLQLWKARVSVDSFTWSSRFCIWHHSKEIISVKGCCFPQDWTILLWGFNQVTVPLLVCGSRKQNQQWTEKSGFQLSDIYQELKQVKGVLTMKVNWFVWNSSTHLSCWLFYIQETSFF